MKLEVRTQDLRLDDRTRTFIDRKVEKLKKRLKRYHPDACRLEIRFAKAAAPNLHECTLELTVPRQVLATKAQAVDLLSAFREGYEALVKKFEKYRLKINKSLRARHHKKIAVRPEPAPELNARKEVLQQAVKRHLKTLYRIARHELLNYQLSGVLEPGEVLPEEIVDEAVLGIYEKFSHQKSVPELEHELIAAVLDTARELAEKAQTDRVPEISVEQAAAAVPDEEEVSTLGEEILYFYEPDEALRIEDLIEDPTAITPEEVVENEELQKLLYSLLSNLPEDQRTAYTLVEIEGFTLEEAAMILRKTSEEVDKLRHEAEEMLRKQLRKDQRQITRERLSAVYKSIKELPFEFAMARTTVVVEELLRRVPEE